MYLVVTPTDFAQMVDHETAINQLAAAARQRQRSEMNPDAGFPRGRPDGLQHFVFFLDASLAEGALAVSVEHSGHFRREQHGSTAIRRLAHGNDQSLGVGDGFDPALRLIESDPHRIHAASNSSSLP